MSSKKEAWHTMLFSGCTYMGGNGGRGKVYSMCSLCVCTWKCDKLWQVGWSLFGAVMAELLTTRGRWKDSYSQ